jgi:hypothetical protein
MKYLKLFEEKTGYDSFVGGEDYIEPHVAVIQNGSNEPIVKYKEKEKEILTIEYSKSYPDILEDLISKYGYNYGSRINPLPFDGDIYVKGFPAVGEGYVKYIATFGPNVSYTVLLYLEDYKQTYYCVALQGIEASYGYAWEYFWD